MSPKLILALWSHIINKLMNNANISVPKLIYYQENLPKRKQIKSIVEK